MALQITVDVNPAHVVLRCQGTFTVEAGLDLIAQAITTAKREGLRAALIDVRAVEGMPSEMERFDIGTFIADHRKDRVRLAMVGTAAVTERASFTEDVATTRGAQFKAFSDVEAAVAWLEKAG